MKICLQGQLDALKICEIIYSDMLFSRTDALTHRALEELFAHDDVTMHTSLN